MPSAYRGNLTTSIVQNRTAVAGAIQFDAQVEAPGAQSVSLNLTVGSERSGTMDAAVRTADTRFAYHAAHFGRSEEDMPGLVRSSYNRWTMLVTTATLFAALAIILRNPVVAFPLVPLLLMVFQAAKYNWNLRTRRIGNTLEFLLAPSAWEPQPLKYVPQLLMLTYEKPVFLEIGGQVDAR